MADAGRPGILKNRWVQLALGITAMGLVANLQYAWTLFVNPIEAKHHWGLSAVQLAFSVFIVVETWLVPVEGWLVDRFGPRLVVAGGAVFAALGWFLYAHADSLMALYIAAAITGVGSGCVYGTCVGNALKWFPDRRGLAAGLTAAGYGSGAAITVIPVAHMIQTSGYEQAFIWFGLAQGAGIFVLAMFMLRAAPNASLKASPRMITSKVSYTSVQMLHTPVFWLIYAMFVAVAAGGLIAAAQIGPIATDYGLAKLPIALGATTLPLLTLTLSINNLCNGFTRPLCGWIGDHIGRENTMFFVYIGEGLSLMGLVTFGHTPIAFIVFSALIFVFWGEIFSGFPALCADTFGADHAASNAGTLYTAKGTAALLVPLASLLATGGRWDRVFFVAAGLSIAAGVAAKFLLAPLRSRTIARANEAMAV